MTATFYQPLPQQQQSLAAAPDNSMDRHLISSAHALASAHPLVASRTLAAGLNSQTSGAKLSCLRMFVSELLKGDRTLGDRIRAELQSTIKDMGE